MISIQNNIKIVCGYCLVNFHFAFLVKNKSGKVGHLGKGEKNFIMKGENNIWKRWCIGLAYLISVQCYLYIETVPLICSVNQ